MTVHLMISRITLETNLWTWLGGGFQMRKAEVGRLMWVVPSHSLSVRGWELSNSIHPCFLTVDAT